MSLNGFCGSRNLFWLVALTLVVSAAGWSQEITGTIVGTVTDPSGAVVPGVKVTVTHTDRNAVIRTLTTDSNGDYVATLLPIGHYQVTAEMEGFKKASQTNVVLNVNDKLTINLKLDVGNLSETVVIEDEAARAKVELQTAVAAGLINGTEIRETALNSRNYEQLVSLMPGVASDAAGDQIYVGVSNPLSGTSNQVTYSVNGTRKTGNNWTVDGADNVDRGSNLTLLNYPSVDAISEFKVLRGQYSAEFGRNGAGQINVITKSGTTKFHGSAYEFFRNDKLAANNFFNNARGILRPPLRYNNFGYTFGGPVYIPGVYNTEKNKTFFFFSQEFRRVINYTTVQATVPTAAEKAGNFPSSVCVAATGNTCTQTGASIPQSNWSPLAAAYIKDIWSKIPDGDSTHTLFTAMRNIYNYRQDLVKIDHTLSLKNALSVRFINDSIPTEEPRGLFTGAALPGVSTTSTNAPGRGWSVRLTSGFSSTFYNEGGWAYSYGAIVSYPIGLDATANSPDIKATLPFPVTLGRIPTLSAGFSSITGFGPYLDYNRNHNIFDNVTKVVGRHTLKFGIAANIYQKTENAAGNNVGSFSFPTTPRPSGTATFLQQWANFLLGNVSSFSQASLDMTPDMRARQFEWYAQDDFRVASNFTLNIGVRHSLYRQPWDANHQLTNFDPSAWDPAKAPQVDVSGNIVANTGDLLNGIIINGRNSPYGDKVGAENNRNFAPRFGFAWDPFRTGRTAIRGGYGISYDLAAYSYWENSIFGNPPFVNSVSIPNTKLDNPAAGTPSISLTPKSIVGAPIETQTPYVQQWSLDAQREIHKGFMLDVGYYASKGTHLLGRVDLNTLQPGAAVAAGIMTATTPLTSSTTPRVNSIRPYRGFTAVNVVRNWFNSDYHSLQVAAELKKGDSSLRLSYTYSKAMSDAGTETNAPQNFYNRKAEYALAPFDRPQILTINYIYFLPFMRNERGFVGRVLGGWELSGITTYNAGLPLTVTSGQGLDWAGMGILGPSYQSPRPDMIGDPNSGPKTLTQWFNTAAFADVPAGQVRPGNAGRYTVRGPGYGRWDFSMFKNIRIHEYSFVQFRAEFFNLFNHTNFQGVGTSYATGSTTFGTITSTRDARVVQLALKFSF